MVDSSAGRGAVACSGSTTEERTEGRTSSLTRLVRCETLVGKLLLKGYEKGDQRNETGQSWITGPLRACSRFGLYGNVGFLRILFGSSES